MVEAKVELCLQCNVFKRHWNLMKFDKHTQNLKKHLKWKTQQTFQQLMHKNKQKAKSSRLEAQTWWDGTSEVVSVRAKEGNTVRFTMIMAKTILVGLHPYMLFAP